jgi:CRISPR-associated exonuclease Cas4
MYAEDDLLLLSGIQHIAFCERQWALIHIEKQWQENVLTIEGAHLHEKVDDPYLKEKRHDVITARAVTLASYRLGLIGIADVIEFEKSESAENSIKIPKRSGFWRPRVVEYKRGKPKHTDCDSVQLCAQTLCLEEMHAVRIDEGAIFYNQTKHRQNIVFDDALRHAVARYAKRMHALYTQGITPGAVLRPACKSCSLYELCMPSLSGLDVENYLRSVT